MNIDDAPIGLHITDTHKAHDNTARASFAGQTLRFYRDIVGSDDDETVITDLLADLRHFCDAAGLDFDAMIDSSFQHWNEEKE
jgi:hypothetical protein